MFCEFLAYIWYYLLDLCLYLHHMFYRYYSVFVSADETCDSDIFHKDTDSVCYFIIRTHKNIFNDAKDACLKEGASLATIDTAEKMQHIRSIKLLNKISKQYGFLLVVCASNYSLQSRRYFKIHTICTCIYPAFLEI